MIKATDIDTKYDLYYITSADRSSMLDVADFTVLYAPVAGICSLHIIIEIALEEGLIIFVLEIFNDFNNNVLPNPV